MRDDQATGLRRLFGRPRQHTLAICGSGGTRIAVEMGRALGELGHRVVILDRSVGEAAAALGLKARYDLLHALEGDRRLDDVLLQADDGLCVLPAARGLERLAVESDNWRRELAAALPALGTRFDVWLVNGLLPGAAPEAPVVLAIAPTARAVTTAYGHIKALARAQGRTDFDVLVHRAPSADAAQQVFSCVADTASRFLAAQLQFLGMRAARARIGPRRGRHCRRLRAAAQNLLSRMQPGAEPRLANAMIEAPTRAYAKTAAGDQQQRIREFAPLVRRMAHHLAAKLPPSVEIDDIIQAGMIGLMDAASRFQEGQGTQFETFASQRIRGAMLDELRRTTGCRAACARRCARSRARCSKLEQQLGRAPTETRDRRRSWACPLAEYQSLLQEARGYELLHLEDFGRSEDDDYLDRHCPDDSRPIRSSASRTPASAPRW